MIYKIEQISSEIAEALCRKITADLPGYFGLPACNEHYAIGVRSRINFAAKVGETFIGLLSLDFPYPTNSNIYWMGVMNNHQGKGVGSLLLHQAALYAKKQASKTMTVETLASFEADEGYLKTYKFYEASGFDPLFNLKPVGYEWNMVYLCKNLEKELLA